jgi:SAM-dependent methyltransferase
VLSRQFTKLCDIRDFEDPQVVRTIRSIIPERDAATHIERKAWEFAMCASFMEDVGALSPASSALSVGAGDERILFWLANRIRRVVATDVYGLGTFSTGEAAASMLEDPSSHAPFPYREDHLDVYRMDARKLDFPDESFDCVISISSVEHFGRGRRLRQAVREMARVLRGGGHMFIATECFVRKRPLPAGVDVLTWCQIERDIVRASGLELMQPFDSSLSSESWDNLTRTARGGKIFPRTGDYWPHVLLSFRGSVFTSVCLPLLKPAELVPEIGTREVETPA